jgi:hypothetical protein
MKMKLIRRLIEWLNKRYPFLMLDVVVGPGRHIHKDPRKRPTAIVTFPQPGVSGTDE